MTETDVAIIGAGPAGLSAAIECARAGAQVVLIDENDKPGGQLFKQIHKFFGSKDHRAGIRGVTIGEELLEEAERLDIDVWLNSEACGIYDNNEVWVVKNHTVSHTVCAKSVIISTGATENAVSFPGWTLPGVMSAGAAQTMINVHRVLPGTRVLMIGSGNVGVIVSYQLLQAGAEVVGVVEAAPTLGGYGVHTAKARRAGVPFYTSHTVLQARGNEQVEEATIIALDEKWNHIPGSETTLAVDTICIAAGLTPLTELTQAAGCLQAYVPVLGGWMPAHDRRMGTTVPGCYVAGDVCGVEEASTAMEEGRLSGINAARALGFLTDDEADKLSSEVWIRLDSLRAGPYGEKRRAAKEVLIAGGETGNDAGGQRRGEAVPR